MSLAIINRLVNFIQVKLHVDEEDVVVKSVEVVNDSGYTIELKVKNELYSIRHFEPLNPIRDVNYGMGYDYDCYLFDKEKNHYVKINFDS